MRIFGPFFHFVWSWRKFSFVDTETFSRMKRSCERFHVDILLDMWQQEKAKRTKVVYPRETKTHHFYKKVLRDSSDPFFFSLRVAKSVFLLISKVLCERKDPANSSKQKIFEDKNGVKTKIDLFLQVAEEVSTYLKKSFENFRTLFPFCLKLKQVFSC